MEKTTPPCNEIAGPSHPLTAKQRHERKSRLARKQENHQVSFWLRKPDEFEPLKEVAQTIGISHTELAKLLVATVIPYLDDEFLLEFSSYKRELGSQAVAQNKESVEAANRISSILTSEFVHILQKTYVDGKGTVQLHFEDLRKQARSSNLTTMEAADILLLGEENVDVSYLNDELGLPTYPFNP
jgi:hypothetical protein